MYERGIARAIPVSNYPSLHLDSITNSNVTTGQRREDMPLSGEHSPSSNQNSIQYQHTGIEDSSPNAEVRFKTLQSKFEALAKDDKDISSRNRLETLEHIGKVESFATFGRAGSIASIKGVQMPLNVNSSSSALSIDNHINQLNQKQRHYGNELQVPMAINEHPSPNRQQSKSKFTYAGDLESIHEEHYGGSVSNLGSITSSP